MSSKNSTEPIGQRGLHFIVAYKRMSKHGAYASIPTGIFGCAINLALSFILARRLRQGTKSWKRFRLLLNLAITDTLTSVYLIANGTMYFLIGDDKGSSKAAAVREILEALKCVTALPPAINYQALCLFQYLALRHPMLYSTFITERFCNGVILTQWMGITALASLFCLKVFMPNSPGRNSFSLFLEIVQMTVYALVVSGAILGYSTLLYTIRNKQKQNKKNIRVKRAKVAYLLLVITSVNFIEMAAFIAALLIVTACLYDSMEKIYKLQSPVSPVNGTLATSVLVNQNVVKTYFEYKTQHLLILTCWMLRLVIDPILQLRFNNGNDIKSSKNTVDLTLVDLAPGITPRVERKSTVASDLTSLKTLPRQESDSTFQEGTVLLKKAKKEGEN